MKPGMQTQVRVSASQVPLPLQSPSAPQSPHSSVPQAAVSEGLSAAVSHAAVSTVSSLPSIRQSTERVITPSTPQVELHELQGPTRQTALSQVGAPHVRSSTTSVESHPSAERPSGDTHVASRVERPLQVAEHGFHSPNSKCGSVEGHASSAHTWLLGASMCACRQLLRGRRAPAVARHMTGRSWTPPPHAALQAPHSPGVTTG
mmetsp:Transcript_24564/g.63805  ORF Transcript_24564/g.63805 Transcript_24564/m.63805 type:complete len:204 (-) Transcript_24564:344-955(-)